MIDQIYQIVKTIVNKELRGDFTPDEFNNLSKQVQDNIFAGYFGDSNLSKSKENRGLVGRNHANISQQIREKINLFSTLSTLPYNNTTGLFTLPDNLYFINDNGVLYNDFTVVEEIQTADFGYMNSSLGAPSTTFPIYEERGSELSILPSTIVNNVTCRYLRRPADPNWTYTVVGGIEMFDNTVADFQDFELHVSELPTIVVDILSLVGINLRESEVAQYAEALKRITEVKKQQ